MNTKSAEVGELISQLIEQTRTDADLRAKFSANPHEALSDAGVVVPETMEIVVAESSPSKLVVPLAPYTGGKLELDELENVSGGLAITTTIVALAAIGGGTAVGLGLVGAAGYVGALVATR